MAVLLSPVGGAAAQFFTNAGVPLSGGKIYTYAAGTSTPQATYTTSAGNIQHSNPIILDAAGRVPTGEIWLTDGLSYKFVLKDANDVLIATYDNIVGINAKQDASQISYTAPYSGAIVTNVEAKLSTIYNSTDYGNAKGTNNIGYGEDVLLMATTAVNNTAMGDGAMSSVTSGFANAAFGYKALSSLTSPCYSTAVGAFALENADYPSNVNLLCTGIGAYALNANTFGQYNTAVGAYSMQFNTEGYFNTAVGRSSLRQNVTGIWNTAIGDAALENSTGDYNTVVGSHSAPLQTSGNRNTIVGANSMANNVTGDDCIAIGYGTLAQSTVSKNICIGNLAGYSLQTGSYNTAIGYNALNLGNGSTNSNVAIGYNSLAYGTSIGSNTAVGIESLSNSNSDRQTAFGANALQYSTSGGKNVALGYAAGQIISTGGNNICIGDSSGTDAVVSLTTQSNCIVMGNNDHTNAYIKVSWTVTSDARDKTNFAEVPHGLEFVNKLKTTAYQMRKSRNSDVAIGPVRYGFKAQDILEIEGSNSVIIDAEDSNNLKYNESSLIPVLVKAIQELKAEIDLLKAK